MLPDKNAKAHERAERHFAAPLSLMSSNKIG